MSLKNFRKNIDDVDEELIKLLGRRFQIIDELLYIKKFSDIPVHQPDREEAMLEKRKRLAREYHLPEFLIEQIFRHIFKVSREYQQKKLVNRQLTIREKFDKIKRYKK